MTKEASNTDQESTRSLNSDQIRDLLGHDVATAPGDIPFLSVVERERSVKHQFRHDNTISPLAPRPHQPVLISTSCGEDIPLVRASVFYTTDGSEPHTLSASIAMSILERSWNLLPGYVTKWEASIPPQSPGTIVRYRIGGWKSNAQTQEPDVWAQDGQGFWFRFEADQGITTFGYSIEEAESSTPEWLDGTVVYQIFLDRFRTDDPLDAFEDSGHRGMHGGTLKGVHRSLDYIKDLGANCLWLSPLHPAETYHRYDSLDFNAVDPRLGTGNDLKQLTAAGSTSGIRFLMDFVPSHVSYHHPAFLAAQANKSAETASWFTFYEHPNRYRTFLDLAKFLPSLNTDNSAARQHLIESAVRWLTEFDMSGFRLDHAIGPSMDFWTAFRKATKDARADSFTTGEATDTPDSLRRYRQRLDSILDFPLARALRSTFALGAWNAEQLDRFLNTYEAFMADGPDRVSFLDNHDMDRFLFIAGNDIERLKMAALCQFSLSAVPVIYYGTEIGIRQEHPSSDRLAGGDANVRTDMIWDTSRWDHDLLNFYRELTRVRRENLVLRRGVRSTIHVDAQENTYAFVRFFRDEGPLEATPLISVFNLSEEESMIEIGDSRCSLGDVLVESRSGSVDVGAREIRMAPKSAGILRA